MKKTITDKDLGIINLTKNNRATRITVRVKQDSIAVTLPAFSTYEKALSFVISKKDWILAQKTKLKVKKLYICNESPFRTLTFEVYIQSAERKNYFISLKNNLLTIEYPNSIDPTSESAQKVFRKAIENGLRHEAKRVLPQMLKKLAGKYGFSYSETKINSSKSRWGSCSSKGSINLSFYLMILPQHLVEYVLLHELCHTKEMNHGVGFWKLMDKVTENQTKKLRLEMKNYHISSIL
jgi:predicted metal-dependent hydrolase